MYFGKLSCNPLSVAEVISDPTFDNQHVAVHGNLFYGEGCEDGEILFLPSEGPFDGKPMKNPKSLDRHKCLLIDQPDVFNDFHKRLGKFVMCGSTLWNVDAILVGQIRRQPNSDHPVRIGNLWLLIAQFWEDFDGGEPFHKLSVSTFPQNSLPQLPWQGIKTERSGGSVIAVYPPFENTTIPTR